MKGITYQQLQVFHAIAREGSISGAARRLEVAPPSISQSLKALETALDLPLFTRTTRRVELTDAGDQLRRTTQEAMEQLDIAVENVIDLRGSPRGTVRLTAPRFAFQWLLASRYAEFCRRFPNIRLEVSLDDAAVNLIEAGFDLGIRFGDRVEEGMVARPLTARTKESLFCSPDYAERHGLPHSIGALTKHALIQYRFGASRQLAPLHLAQEGQQVPIDMPLAMVVNDTDLMMDAARRGLGIGRILEPMVAESLADGRLLPVLEKHWIDYPGLHVYYPRGGAQTARVRALLDFLLEIVEQGPPGADPSRPGA